MKEDNENCCARKSQGAVCAKTTALNLAIVMACQGLRVLAVDLDPQGNLSVAFGADLQELESPRCTSRRMIVMVST